MEAYNFGVIRANNSREQYLFTDAPINLIHAGQTWVNKAITRSGYSRIAPDGALTITAPEPLFNLSPGDKLAVQIFSCRDFNVGPAFLTCNELKPLVTGTLIGTEISDSGVNYEFTVGVKPSLLLATRKFTRKCPFVFGSAQCGVDRASFATTVTIHEISPNGKWLKSNTWNTIGVADWMNPSEWDSSRPSIGSTVIGPTFTEHFVVELARSAPGAGAGAGERWIKVASSIIDASGAVETAPFTVDILPSCDKTHNACTSYGNEANFGGWPDLSFEDGQ